MTWRREPSARGYREPGTDAGEVPGRDRTIREGAHYVSRIGGLSHVQILLFPSDRHGSGPLRVPVTGHNVYLDLVADGSAELVLHGFRTEVLSRRPLEPDGVSLVPRTGPALVVGDDLAGAHRRGPEHYEPMLTPDVEVFLDRDPPLVRTALDAQGAPAWPDFRLPLRLGPGSEARVVLSPHTEDRGLVDWRLIADVSCGGRGSVASWHLQVTAETTFRSWAPHWRPAWPPDRAPERALDGHGAKDPHEADYLRARRAEDVDQCIRELLGMRVWLPLRGPERNAIVAHRGGSGLVSAYTSVERAGRLVRPEGEPATVQVRRFAGLVQAWRHPDLGLVINPYTESEFQIPCGRLHRVTRVQAELNGGGGAPGA